MEELFDKARIRAELKRLDKITGLKGAELPIKFGNTKHTLGRFCCRDKDSLEFYFSNYYFSDDNFPVEGKLDVIRHEYAHYYDYILNGYSSHGANWKRCCRIVGASPSRLFNQERANSILERREKERLKNLELDDKYCAGKTIVHPRFGCGTIKRIDGSGLSRIALVDFQNGVTKKLSLIWISENSK